MLKFNTRICKCCKNEEHVSIWEIWKKIHISNEYTESLKTGSQWRISSKSKIFFRLCFFCYGVIFALLYLFYILHMTIDPSGNLFYIFLNLVIAAIPLILIELVLIFTVPIECKQKDNL